MTSKKQSNEGNPSIMDDPKVEGNAGVESKVKPKADSEEKSGAGKDSGVESKVKPKAESKKKSGAKRDSGVESKGKPKIESGEKSVVSKEPEKEAEVKKEVEVLVKSEGASEEGMASEEDLALWVPKTDLGKRVHGGEITSIHEVIRLNTPIKEVEVVNKLLPELEEEILNVGRVQRVTDSGRRMRFRIVTAVGNHNGLVGVGVAKGKEAGPTIRKAIRRAKLNIAEVKRGCSSWECGCGNPHTVPTKASGKSGSVEITFIPAPRGVGLACGEIPRKILALAGIKDVWTITSGHTRTNINLAFAVYNALVNTNYVKFKEQDIERLGIKTGQA